MSSKQNAFQMCATFSALRQELNTVLTRCYNRATTAVSRAEDCTVICAFLFVLNALIDRSIKTFSVVSQTLEEVGEASDQASLENLFSECFPSKETAQAPSETTLEVCKSA